MQPLEKTYEFMAGLMGSYGATVETDTSGSDGARLWVDVPTGHRQAVRIEATDPDLRRQVDGIAWQVHVIEWDETGGETSAKLVGLADWPAGAVALAVAAVTHIRKERVPVVVVDSGAPAGEHAGS